MDYDIRGYKPHLAKLDKIQIYSRQDNNGTGFFKSPYPHGRKLAQEVPSQSKGLQEVTIYKVYE